MTLVPASSSGGSGGSTVQGYEIGYDQVTGNVTVASTTESSGTTLITCAAHTFDGGAVLVTFFCPWLNTSTTNSTSVTACLFEGATQITRLFAATNGATNSIAMPVVGMYRFTPTAASHTYKVTAFASNTTTATIFACGAGGTGAQAPMFIRFTKV